MKNRNLRRRPCLHLPAMAPFASLLFIVGCFFLLTAAPKTPLNGLVRLEETPYRPCGGCLYGPDHAQLYVCLTSAGRLSFAVSEMNLQLASLAEVYQKYGIALSAKSVANLNALPFAATKRTSAAALLSSVESNQADTAAYPLTEAQLLDCVTSSRRLSPKLTGMPSGVYLVVNAQTKASRVLRLFQLLQQREITRFYLLTHCV